MDTARYHREKNDALGVFVSVRCFLDLYDHWISVSGPVFSDDAGRGAAARVPQTRADPLVLHSGAARRADQDVRQRPTILRLLNGHA